MSNDDPWREINARIHQAVDDALKPHSSYAEGHARADGLLAKQTEMLRLCRARADLLSLERGEQVAAAAIIFHHALDGLRTEIVDMDGELQGRIHALLNGLLESIMTIAETSGILSDEARHISQQRQAELAQNGRRNPNDAIISDMLAKYQAMTPRMTDFAISEQAASDLAALKPEAVLISADALYKRLRKQRLQEAIKSWGSLLKIPAKP